MVNTKVYWTMLEFRSLVGMISFSVALIRTRREKKNKRRKKWRRKLTWSAEGVCSLRGGDVMLRMDLDILGWQSWKVQVEGCKTVEDAKASSNEGGRYLQLGGKVFVLAKDTRAHGRRQRQRQNCGRTQLLEYLGIVSCVRVGGWNKIFYPFWLACSRFETMVILWWLVLAHVQL